MPCLPLCRCSVLLIGQGKSFPDCQGFSEFCFQPKQKSNPVLTVYIAKRRSSQKERIWYNKGAPKLWIVKDNRKTMQTVSNLNSETFFFSMHRIIKYLLTPNQLHPPLPHWFTDLGSHLPLYTLLYNCSCHIPME